VRPSLVFFFPSPFFAPFSPAPRALFRKAKLTKSREVVDLQPLYPQSLIPSWMRGIIPFYVKTYNDLFFIGEPQPFFEFFMYMEAFIQVPVMIWGIPALLRGK
jgi:hypothetical protein